MSLIVGLAEGAGGVLLLAAGFTGSSLLSVFQGAPDRSETGGSSTAAAGGSQGTTAAPEGSSETSSAGAGVSSAPAPSTSAGGADPTVTRWLADAEIASKKYNIPVSTILGQIQVESGGNLGEVSSAGATGLTQFLPGTANEYVPGGAAAAAGTTNQDALDQILGEAKYLDALGYQQGGATSALEGYYAGTPGSSLGSSYAQSVLAAAARYTSYNDG